MKNIEQKISILFIMLCVVTCIGCTVGPSIEESGPVSETGLSEEAGTLGSEVGSTGGSGGAVKEDGRLMDDTYYVADVYEILMLCKGDEDPGYRENIRLLKGDRASVEKAIEGLLDMEQTPAVMNAIGVGNMRLDQFEDAKRILNKALGMADEIDSVCILNNLGSAHFLETEDIINDTIADEYDLALEKTSVPIDRIILRTNQLGYGPFVYLGDDDWEKTMTEDIDRLLKEEKELLGSNQVAGIYNYLTLAMYDLADGQVEALDKALGLNGDQHRYRAVDIVAYSGLTGCYHQEGDIDRALMYADKYIEAVEGFLVEADPSRIAAYFGKGVLLVREKRYDEALQCMSPLLELEGCGSDQKALLYLRCGEAYYGKGDPSKAEEMVEKAYDFFDLYEKEEGDSGWDIDEMLEQHDKADYNAGDQDYMQWVRDQLQG